MKMVILMKLNNKGFSLTEIIAVVVILGVLAIIMIPSVTGILTSNKEKSYENLKKSIIRSAEIYISNNRYDIAISSCTDDKATITNVANNTITSSQIPLRLLTDSGDMEAVLLDPRNKNKKINLDDSYIIVTFNCTNKEYDYDLQDGYLIWE